MSHETSAAVAIMIVGLTCFAAGIVVGAVHGLFLIRLVAPIGSTSVFSPG